MVRYLYVLVFVTACTLSSAARQNTEACSTDPPYGKLASLLTVSHLIDCLFTYEVTSKFRGLQPQQLQQFAKGGNITFLIWANLDVRCTCIL